jgi:hypothetical protein
MKHLNTLYGEYFVGWKIIELNQPINSDVVLWKIHNSSLLTAISPQNILATISVSPKPKFLTRQLVRRLEDTDTKPTPGDCAGAKPPDLDASGPTARRERQDLDAAALPGCASVAEAFAAEPPHSGEDGAAAPAEPAPAGKAGKTGSRKTGGGS